MSSSFTNYNGMVNVSNMMFWRVCEFALELAKEKDVLSKEVIEKFAKIEANFGRTPDVDIDDYFTLEELDIWAWIFNELADKIFNREIGNQESREWQVWTIWTACSMSRLFQNSFRFHNRQASRPDTKAQRYRRLGQLALKNNDTQEALKSFKRALRADPKSVATTYLLGLAYKKLGLMDKANAYLEKAEKMNGWMEWY